MRGARPDVSPFRCFPCCLSRAYFSLALTEQSDIIQMFRESELRTIVVTSWQFFHPLSGVC